MINLQHVISHLELIDWRHRMAMKSGETTRNSIAFNRIHAVGGKMCASILHRQRHLLTRTSTRGAESFKSKAMAVNPRPSMRRSMSIANGRTGTTWINTSHHRRPHSLRCIIVTTEERPNTPTPSFNRSELSGTHLGHQFGLGRRQLIACTANAFAAIQSFRAIRDAPWPSIWTRSSTI